MHVQQFNGTVLSHGHQETLCWKVNYSGLHQNKQMNRRNQNSHPLHIYCASFVRWLGLSADFFELSSEFEAYLLYFEKLNLDVCKSHP